MLREVLVSPAPMYSVALGKILGGATVAVIQGSIPLLFAPFIGVEITVTGLLLAWLVMFSIGVMITSLGVVIATRMKTFEGFGSISNGVIQPLYFLSGSIFPLTGVIGGVGFLEIPMELRAELRRIGVRAIGGGWIVELPNWLQVLVYSNPVSYQLDLLRYVTLSYQQLPLTADLLVTLLLPPAAALVATFAMTRLRSR